MPGFKSFTSTVLTAADVNDYLMEQAVIQCTSATRPTPTHDGMLIYESDNKQYLYYEDGAWVVLHMDEWQGRTPTLTNFTNAATNVQEWVVHGPTVHLTGHFTVSSTTGLGNPIAVDLPFAPWSSTAGLHYVGSCFFYDASANQFYPGACYIWPADSVIRFITGYATSVTGLAGTSQIGDNPGFSLGGVGDGIYYSITYERVL